MLQNIGRCIIGVVYHPVGVHAVEVVLEIRQKQGAHAPVSYTHLDVYKRQHGVCSLGKAI